MKRRNIPRELEIIELCKIKSQREVAKKYGLTQSGIALILSRYNLKFKKSRLSTNYLPLNENYFECINVPEKAYWLGFIYADGHITKNNNKVSIISKDKGAISGFKKCIKSGHKISERHIFDKRTKKTYHAFAIQIGRETFVSHLIRLGVTNKKTDHPSSSKSAKSAFLQKNYFVIKEVL